MIKSIVLILLLSAAMSKGISTSNTEEQVPQACFNVQSVTSVSNTVYEWEIVGSRCRLEHTDIVGWDPEEDCKCSSLDCTESLVGPCALEFCPMCFSNPELGEAQECCLPADEESFYMGYKHANEEGVDGAMHLVERIPNNDQGYKACSEPQKKRCNSTPFGKHNGVNEESCKKICDENEKCNYVFWNKGWYCALYEDCFLYEDSKGVGTVFAKKGKGLYCPDPCIDKLETSKCEAKKANGKCNDFWINDYRFVRRHCKRTCDVCVDTCGNCPI